MVGLEQMRFVSFVMTSGDLHVSDIFSVADGSSSKSIKQLMSTPQGHTSYLKIFPSIAAWEDAWTHWILNGMVLGRVLGLQLLAPTLST
jgi:hypothetical protein